MASFARWPADARRHGARGLVLVVTGLAALSLLAPSQPGYDAWAWLLWGRESVHLDLDTSAGPAFKPLPVAITAVLSIAGDAAPGLWLVVARAGALAAVALAALAAYRLSAGSRLAAAIAGGGVALSAGFPWHAAIGNSEGLFLALVLGAVERAAAGRHHTALGLALGAGLLRPEAWPFLALYGLWLFVHRPQLRIVLVLSAVGLLAVWTVPDWIAAGDPLRSSERARVPNPGAPALADRPAWASLRRAAEIPLAPLLAALPLLGFAPRGPRMQAAAYATAGGAWVLLVAAMAELGYSGEPRYALPGAALLAIPAAVAAGWTARAIPRHARPAAIVLALAAVAPFLIARVDRIGAELRRAADDARLYGSLPDAIARAGGASRLRACGVPVVGPYRGPATAWALGVHRSAIAFDARRGGPVLRSRLRPAGPMAPDVAPGLALLGRAGRWEIRGRCRP